MADKIKNLIHGRETYIADFGPGFVMKRPLPTFGVDAREKWLEKQYRTKAVIDEIWAVGNPRYNIPRMHFIKDDEYQLLEERAPGFPLTAELYRGLSRREKYEITDGIAAFLVDMNELRPIKETEIHKIADDIKFKRLDNFVENKMSSWFTKNEVRQMARLRDEIGKFEYETRLAWSHCDLNSGNVLYDPETRKLSFIDFAEANYQFIYRDIFAPLQIELGIFKHVYATYCQLHNGALYPMPSTKNESLHEIMKYRILTVVLKRFIKASDDLRANPQNQKSINNNADKVAFMREQIAAFQAIERAFSR